jgi:predicted nucleic acid-binding Zn ribbon protein
MPIFQYNCSNKDCFYSKEIISSGRSPDEKGIECPICKSGMKFQPFPGCGFQLKGDNWEKKKGY